MTALRWFMVVSTLFLLTGCFPMGIADFGPTVTRELDLADFNKVAAGSSFAVEIRQSETFSVEISADEAVFNYLDVGVSGDTLRIYLKKGYNLIGRRTLQARVMMPTLTGLDLSGATQTTISGFDALQPLAVQLSGASGLRGDIKSRDARFDVSGASKVALQGRAEGLNVKVSGASTLQLDQFTAADVVVNASGASHVDVAARGVLDVDADGASAVRYVGKPTQIKTQLSGAATVRAR